jgi:HlyD family secretion protein
MSLKHLGLRLAILAAFCLGVGAGVFVYFSRTDAPPSVTTVTVTRGDLVDAIAASGTLEAVTTVQVGTQVSGTVKDLLADFNDIVQEGQVIARLDPSLFQTQVDQARANVIRAEADVQRLEITLADAQAKLARATQLADKQLIAQAELETAAVNVRSASAQLSSAQAQVAQAQASLNQAQVSLDHTVIASPIDGIVVSRNVDVGQTVAASMQAPTLYVLAADLTRMRVNASLDEADIGRVRQGQTVSFRVDAYPGEQFEGRVAQVRLQPVVSQNVVSYVTVIDVPNRELKLKPGMTATVSIEVARRSDVLRLANAALRFRPSSDVLTALGQPTRPPDGPSVERAGARTSDVTVAARSVVPGSGGATVWRYLEDRLQPVAVRIGISDGSLTEIAEGLLNAGDEFVTLVSTGTPSSTRAANTITSPLMGSPPPGPPPGPPPW